MKHILLGITGSIAAYKAADIANTLTKEGHCVHTVMTQAAMKFITPLTLQTLTKQKVYTDMFDESDPSVVAHIALAEKADLALIAPASANFLAKAAVGIADDMLSTTFLALQDKPIVICPAMNTHMYENPAVQQNIRILQERGCYFAEPRSARLACGTVGKGALADLETILTEVRKLL